MSDTDLRASAQAALAAFDEHGGFSREEWPEFESLRTRLSAAYAECQGEIEREREAAYSHGYGDGLASVPLDIERLATATARVVGWTGPLDYHREWATKVAREYAKL